MNVLPPGWEVPDALPHGVTVAPAADPVTAARIIAERIGGEVLVDVAAAERALAREMSRTRAVQLVADAAEAARLVAALDGSDAAADRALLAAPPPVVPAGLSAERLARDVAVIGEVRVDADDVAAAAARLRTAELTAAAAARVVGDRPSSVAADMELVRARSRVAEIDAELADDDERGAGSIAGLLALAAGGALMLVGAGAPVALAACVPGLAGGGTVTARRRRRRSTVARRAERELAMTALDRAEAAMARVMDDDRAWRSRAAAADEAACELAAAREAWTALVGDVAVERAPQLVESLRHLAGAAAAFGVDESLAASQVMFAARRLEQATADVAAAREREATRVRLHDLLHGRRFDRLQAEAAAARTLLGTEPPRALVLCDPFATLGRNRRRALMDDLERAPSHLTLAVVTSDEEALAWAAVRSRTR